MKAVYSSLVIILPSGSPDTLIFAIQLAPSGSLLRSPGWFSRALFTSVTVPPMGLRISEADLTDSTAPIASPPLTSRSISGSSTKTTSPRAFAAYSEIPSVPGGRVSGVVSREAFQRTGLAVSGHLDPLVVLSVLLRPHYSTSARHGVTPRTEERTGSRHGE